ncbi:methylaspartate ammonia-lyase [Lentisphaerota bacterium ZTH]|nr:methylaspartate ammonia-lyase [Lentisphaerota bacterium]WET05098.1 methylaspartate ammonia-lyase [Lentisphaerota bacterium ZTH]
MKINKITYSAGKTGFFFDDQRAIKQGAGHDGFNYVGQPVTEGFKAIRQSGESISIMLELDNGQVGIGDAAAVQYSGAGGRDPLFLAETYIPFMKEHLNPILKGLNIECFRETAAYIDQLKIDGKPLHTALRYGLSQALLDAKAKSENKLMCEVICEEYSLPVIPEPVPIFGQSGDDRYNGSDKMIIKGVDVLPHALINHIETKLGNKGEKLAEYVQWLTDRIFELGPGKDYRPAIHIDVYGNLGPIFDFDPVAIAQYLKELGTLTQGLPLYIEGPVDMEGKEPQIEMLGKIKAEMERLGATTKIVADEWCNTYDDIVDFTDTQCCHMVQIKTPDLGSIHNTVKAVLYCQRNGMEAYQGGTCNETDVSSRCCAQAALATRPARILAKPGMGFDEGFMITNNEMQRSIALLRSKYGEAEE